jgi:hypothetical protein
MKASAGNTTMKDDIKTVLQNMGPVDFKGKTALVTGGLDSSAHICVIFCSNTVTGLSAWITFRSCYNCS